MKDGSEEQPPTHGKVVCPGELVRVDVGQCSTLMRRYFMTESNSGHTAHGEAGPQAAAG